MGRTTGWAVLALGIAVGPVGGQQLELSGQIRPRFEARDPVPTALVGADETLEFTSMRTRLSLAASLVGDVRAFVQLQDVRVWGSEAGTLDGAAEGMDLHQGWLELGDPKGGLSVRAGRQELVYGGQRLVGAVNWAQQARAFDGVRVRYRGGGLVMDGFAAQVGDFDGADRPDESLFGAYATATALGLDGYVLFHARDERVGGIRGLTRDRSEKYTFGGRWVSSEDGLDWRVEAAYQLGEARVPDGVADVAAWMFGARAGTRFTDALGLTLWYDYLSGDDDPGDGEVRVFDTLFATNHKFYGFMDLFLDIPGHTSGRGLQDLALKADYAVAEAHELRADLHLFRYAATGGLESGRIGEEIDLTYRWGYAPGATITGGASYFFAGDPVIPRAPAADDGMVWGYVMVDVFF